MENEDFLEENYIKEEIIVNIVCANVFGIIVIMMPLIVIGIIPTIISIIIGNPFLLFLGIIFITGGDILMFLKTLIQNRDSWIFDHPILIPANWQRRSLFRKASLYPPTSQTAGTLCANK